MHMKTACVCVVKNAELRIAEWIAYQFAVGFDSVVLLDNNSTDRTKDIARHFQAKYDVRIIDWPSTKKNYQVCGYKYALKKYQHEFDWCAFFDDDEFLTLPPKKTLEQLVDLPLLVSGIAVPWAMFGSNGHIARPNDLVIKSYMYRKNDHDRHIKSIVRPKFLTKPHSPHYFKSREGFLIRFFSFIKIKPNIYVDMQHKIIRKSQPVMEVALGFDGGQLNHYYLRSRQDWDEKIARGYHDIKRDPNEFSFYDRNEVYDDSALRYLPKVEEILSGIDFNMPLQPLQPPSVWQRLSVWWASL